MNAQQIWQAVLGDLHVHEPRMVSDTWLRYLSAVSLTGDRIVLSAPSSYARDWFESRLAGQVARSLKRVVGRPVSVEVIVGESEPKKRRTRGQSAQTSLPEPEAPRTSLDSGAEDHRRSSDVGAEGVGPLDAQWEPSWRPNPRYTFAEFVVGPSNQLAHAAAMSVAESPGEAYNPFFIYGGVGLGKTHLLHAIAHVVSKGGKRALYVTSETFTNDLVAAIRGNRNNEFRARYRTNDVLLVDDVQFIAGKEATQEEFFHTFNSLHEAGKQVVLSSDRPPRAIQTLEDRLRSRFEWGLIADIQPPDVETRMAILQSKAVAQPIPVPPDVIALIAQRIQSNIRELEGSLNRVVAHARITGRPLTVDLAQSALAEVMAGPGRRRIVPSQVVEAVARFYRVEPRALRGKARDREIVVPRQVAMYLMREETEASLLEIGRELGGKDHSTVLHGVAKITSEVEANSTLRRDVLAIRDTLYSSPK